MLVMRLRPLVLMATGSVCPRPAPRGCGVLAEGLNTLFAEKMTSIIAPAGRPGPARHGSGSLVKLVRH